jgi:hypothetical protein
MEAYMSDWYNPFSWGDSDSPDFGDIEGILAENQARLEELYGPYTEMGLRLMPTLEEQYNTLMTDPAAMQTMLGSGYTQSPGYQYNLDQQMNAMNQSLAAGGMLGTPTAQSQMMGVASGEASQDYWKYYGANADLFNTGLEGTQGLFDTGYNATNQLAGGLSNVYGSQANLAYANMASKDQMFSSALGGAMGLAGKMMKPGPTKAAGFI